MHKQESTGTAVIAALFWALTIAGANAGEGVIEINQALALEGGVTPGDDPGFPVTISQPGSYVLTGNLEVTADVGAIEIKTSDISLDLRGFRIRGSGGGVDVDGIVTAEFDPGALENGDRIEVRNGTVQNFHDAGIRLRRMGRVLDVRLTDNGFAGATVRQDGIMRGNTARNNGILGLLALDNSQIVGNVVAGSPSGIDCEANCVVRDNTVGPLNTSGLSVAVETQGSVIHGNAFQSAGSGVVGSDNLITDNLIRDCDTGIEEGGFGSSNTLRGNVLLSNGIHLDDPVFFLGPNRCDNATCQ